MGIKNKNEIIQNHCNQFHPIQYKVLHRPLKNLADSFPFVFGCILLKCEIKKVSWQYKKVIHARCSETHYHTEAIIVRFRKISEMCKHHTDQQIDSQYFKCPDHIFLIKPFGLSCKTYTVFYRTASPCDKPTILKTSSGLFTFEVLRYQKYQKKWHHTLMPLLLIFL